MSFVKSRTHPMSTLQIDLAAFFRASPCGYQSELFSGDASAVVQRSLTGPLTGGGRLPQIGELSDRCAIDFEPLAMLTSNGHLEIPNLVPVARRYAFDSHIWILLILNEVCHTSHSGPKSILKRRQYSRGVNLFKCRRMPTHHIISNHTLSRQTS